MKLFEGRPSKNIDCLAFEIAPQTRSPPEVSGGQLFHVFVLKCENDLASFILNGAKLELRSGDHLIIKAGSSFHFTNSSLSTPLKLRILHRKSTV